MTRQEINRKILVLLSQLNDSMPDQRFAQLIINAGVSIQSLDFNTKIPLNEIDYNEESEITFVRVRKNKKQLDGM